MRGAIRRLRTWYQADEQFILRREVRWAQRTAHSSFGRLLIILYIVFFLGEQAYPFFYNRVASSLVTNNYFAMAERIIFECISITIAIAPFITWAILIACRVVRFIKDSKLNVDLILANISSKLIFPNIFIVPILISSALIVFWKFELFEIMERIDTVYSHAIYHPYWAYVFLTNLGLLLFINILHATNIISVLIFVTFWLVEKHIAGYNILRLFISAGGLIAACVILAVISSRTASHVAMSIDHSGWSKYSAQYWVWGHIAMFICILIQLIFPYLILKLSIKSLKRLRSMSLHSLTLREG